MAIDLVMTMLYFRCVGQEQRSLLAPHEAERLRLRPKWHDYVRMKCPEKEDLQQKCTSAWDSLLAEFLWLRSQ